MSEDPEVGKGYRGRDGVVRWVTHRSQRGNYHLLWHDEAQDVWHNGGIIKGTLWHRGGLSDQGEAKVPQPGESYQRAGWHVKSTA